MIKVRVLDETQRKAGPGQATDALALARRLPRIVIEARRIAATAAHGIHGRRQAGTGEAFWQFRHFTPGEPANRVDWRRSARDDHYYVREKEWEAAHTVWLWTDRSASMAYASSLAQAPKIERALVLGPAAPHIDILDSQQESAARAPRDFVGEQRRIGRTQMQQPGGRGGKTRHDHRGPENSML
jgi:hypothetical protein